MLPAVPPRAPATAAPQRRRPPPAAVDTRSASSARSPSPARTPTRAGARSSHRTSSTTAALRAWRRRSSRQRWRSPGSRRRPLPRSRADHHPRGRRDRRRGTLVIAAAPTLFVAALGLVVAGAGTAVLFPTVIGIVWRNVEESRRGRATWSSPSSRTGFPARTRSTSGCGRGDRPTRRHVRRGGARRRPVRADSVLLRLTGYSRT